MFNPSQAFLSSLPLLLSSSFLFFGANAQSPVPSDAWLWGGAILNAPSWPTPLVNQTVYIWFNNPPSFYQTAENYFFVSGPPNADPKFPYSGYHEDYYNVTNNTAGPVPHSLECGSTISQFSVKPNTQQANSISLNWWGNLNSDISNNTGLSFYVDTSNFSCTWSDGGKNCGGLTVDQWPSLAPPVAGS